MYVYFFFYITNSTFYLDFSSFLFLFSSRIPSRHHIGLSPSQSPSGSSAVTVGQAFLVSDDLDTWSSTAQLYCRLSLSLSLVDWGSEFGRRNRRDEAPS